MKRYTKSGYFELKLQILNSIISKPLTKNKITEKVKSGFKKTYLLINELEQQKLIEIKTVIIPIKKSHKPKFKLSNQPFTKTQTFCIITKAGKLFYKIETQKKLDPCKNCLEWTKCFSGQKKVCKEFIQWGDKIIKLMNQQIGEK